MTTGDKAESKKPNHIVCAARVFRKGELHGKASAEEVVMSHSFPQKPLSADCTENSCCTASPGQQPLWSPSV